MPRAKPAGATLQLASADAQIVPAPKAKAEAQADRCRLRRQGRAEAADAGRHHQCPRLLGRRSGRTEAGHPGAGRRPQARQALAAARSAADRQRHRDLQQGAGLRAGRLLAGRPLQHRRRHRADPAQRPARPARNAVAAHRHQHRRRQGRAGSGQRGRDLDPARRRQGQRRLDARDDAGAEREHAMSTTVLGDADMTLMRGHFVKPQAIVAMTFSDDPMMGMVTDRFTGSATAQLRDAVVRGAHRLAALSASRTTSHNIRCRPREREDPYARARGRAMRAPRNRMTRRGYGSGSRFAWPGRRGTSANASQHPQRLHVGFQDGFLLRRARWRPACACARWCAAP